MQQQAAANGLKSHEAYDESHLGTPASFVPRPASASPAPLDNHHASNLTVGNILNHNSSHEKRPPKKSVSFSTLQIRTYETILGDNPSCSGGPSLSIGWRYDPTHLDATVDEYETQQSHVYGVDPLTGAREYPRPEDLVLHRVERVAILLNTGYTRQDLAESIRASNRVKNKRRQTVHNLPVAFVEERMEVVMRTLRRWVGKRQRTRHMYEEWKKREGTK